MENNKKTDKSMVIAVTFSIVMFLNVIFIVVFIAFMGFFIGKIDSGKRFLEGMQIGKEKGRYEVYLELEQKQYGYYSATNDTFIFLKDREDREDENK